jgi:hypothetical protein
MPTNVMASTKCFGIMLWNRRADRCVPYLSEDFSFVAPFDNTIGFGTSRFVQYCCRTKPIPHHLSFRMNAARVVHEDTVISVVLVIGDLSLMGGRTIAHVRYSFVWHRDASGIKLVHLHASVPTLHRIGKGVRSLVVPSGESPGREGVTACDKPTFVRDVRGTTRVIDSYQTTYLEASHQYVIVHLRGGSFKVRHSLTDLLSQLPPCFVRVHRSYAVNAFLIVGIRGPLITLVNGDTVSMPTKRVREIRDALQQAVAESPDTTRPERGEASDR